MSTRAPRLPLNLGRSVQHRSDPTKTVGILVGWVFDPPLGALVRWQDGGATFEVREDIKDLLDVIGIPAVVSVADQIRRRVERGILPLTAPVKTASTRLAQWQPCDGCDELIAPRQVAFALEYLAPRRVVRLHGACHRLWEAECQRRGQPGLSSSEPRMPGEMVGCALCQKPIEARQNVVFRRDGRAEHVTCLEPSRKPLARLVPEAAADPICAGCSEPIGAADSVAKDGEHIVHIRCLVRRPIAGAAALSAWTLIGDEHIGRRLGRTRAGHRDFMEACAETRLTSHQTLAWARGVVAEAREARRRSAA